MSTANRMAGNPLLSRLKLLASVSISPENSSVRDGSSITSQNFSDFLIGNAGQKKFFEEKGNCSGLDGELYRSESEMRSLGYIEVLFIYTIIHVNKLPS